MSPPLLPYVVMFRNFLSIEVKPSKWVLGEWASYGFAAALSLCLLAWCLYFTAPSYIQYPRILLAGALAASYMQKEGITTSRPAAFLFGISAFLTLEMAVTGCACGCHVGSVFNTLLLPLKALTHVLWLWAAVPLALVVHQIHAWSFAARNMLLKVWLLSRSTTKGGTLKLNVPEVTYELMDTAIEQLTWDEMTQLSADDMTKLDLRIAFMDSSCFTTDAIDRGGLTKHFATLISKAVRLATGDRAWPFLTLWDADVAQPAYHLNYEACLYQQQNLACGLERVEADYKALGNLVALLLVKQVPFLRLSKALIKFLLRDRESVHTGQVDPSLRVTLDDLAEVKPDFARMLRDPTLAGIEDLFCQCDLPTKILDQGAISISTDIPPGPWDPTSEHCQQVATHVLENPHVLPITEAFRQGFQSRLQTDGLRLLFSVAEIQGMLAGSDTISVVDWQEHTVYISGSERHPVIRMLWHTLMQCTQEQLQAFLLESTGLLAPPADGFRALEPPFNICILEESEVPDALRQAKLGFHTCCNTLDLLSTTTEQELRSHIQHLMLGRQD
ncbi:UPL1 [Symbiodinium pilosum]|uniref:HECT-type E3 ubiquitin transferase n=1 Tax=Symbiodinium pilosum TaxID=2952 RepID=A0A812S372_SYMPI|nr:UPL1 [Symbiodinium pilosum]